MEVILECDCGSPDPTAVHSTECASVMDNPHAALKIVREHLDCFSSEELGQLVEEIATEIISRHSSGED
jgi:hypothetical protein